MINVFSMRVLTNGLVWLKARFTTDCFVLVCVGLYNSSIVLLCVVIVLFETLCVDKVLGNYFN